MMSLSYSDAVMFGAVAALATNYLLLRVPGWENRRLLFWLVQLINLTAGTWMFGVGVPDLRESADIANKMFGLLFFYHIVSNNLRLQKKQRQNRSSHTEAERSQREQIRAALRASNASSTESDAP